MGWGMGLFDHGHTHLLNESLKFWFHFVRPQMKFYISIYFPMAKNTRILVFILSKNRRKLEFPSFVCNWGDLLIKLTSL